MYRAMMKRENNICMRLLLVIMMYGAMHVHAAASHDDYRGQSEIIVQKDDQVSEIMGDADYVECWGRVPPLRACEVTTSAAVDVGTVTVNTITLPPAFTDINVCDTTNVNDLCSTTLAAGSVYIQNDQYADYYGNYHDYDTMCASRSIFAALETVDTITPFDGAPDLDFGTATALSADGNVIAVGAPNSGISGAPSAVYMYRWEGGTWNFVQKIISPHTVAPGIGAILFGSSLSLSYDGSVLAIADTTQASSGVVDPLTANVWLYVYDALTDQWLLQQEIPNVAPGNTEQPLNLVIPRLSASGKYLMIGCLGVNTFATIYVRQDECGASGALWKFQETLQAGNNNSQNASAQGTYAAMSADGTTVILFTGVAIPSITVYKRFGDEWFTQQTKLLVSSLIVSSVCISADGQYFAVTAGSNSLRIFTHRGTDWVMENTIALGATHSEPLMSADGSVIILFPVSSTNYKAVYRTPDNVYQIITFNAVFPSAASPGSTSISADGAVYAVGDSGVSSVYVVRAARSLTAAETAICGTLCVAGTATIPLLSLTGNLQVNGVVTTGAAVTACSTSDETVKSDITDVDAQMVQQFLATMKPVHFTWKDSAQHCGDTALQAGFVAQDVEQQFPDWVTRDADEHGNVRASLQLPHEMLGYMIAALKNLQHKDAEQALCMKV